MVLAAAAVAQRSAPSLLPPGILGCHRRYHHCANRLSSLSTQDHHPLPSGILDCHRGCHLHCHLFISSSTGDHVFSLWWPSSSTKLSYSSLYQSSSSSPPTLLLFQHLPPQPTWCSPSYIHLHKVCQSCSLLWHVSTKGGTFLYIGFIFMMNLSELLGNLAK